MTHTEARKVAYRALFTVFSMSVQRDGDPDRPGNGTISGFTDMALEAIEKAGLQFAPAAAPIAFRPGKNRVLVRPVEVEHTVGNLILPETRAVGHRLGIVIASSVAGIPVGVKVMFSRFIGCEVRIDGEMLIILRDEKDGAVSEIMGIWSDD